MLYLASRSPRRKRLLKSLKLPFCVVRPFYKEENFSGRPPMRAVRTHALGKARSVVRRIRSGSVLAADTVVCFRGRVIGKPKDRRDAFRILNRLQGRWHTVYTGVAILFLKDGRVRKERVFCQRTRVKLKKMSRAAIAGYFKKVNPLDKAGAYAIQSARANIVDELKGSFSNAVGLPLERLRRGLLL